jgi:hypothetical protein
LNLEAWNLLKLPLEALSSMVWRIDEQVESVQEVFLTQSGNA